MTVKELFDFITDLTIADESVDDYLEKVCGGFEKEIKKSLVSLYFYETHPLLT